MRAIFPSLAAAACVAAAVPAHAAPVYLACSEEEPLVVDRADAVMLDRDGRRVVWMERVGAGEWRRTSYEIVATTPREVSASARRGGDDLHVTLNVSAWTFERERPRPRADNANVLDADAGRFGVDEGHQLYLRERGRCEVQR